MDRKELELKEAAHKKQFDDLLSETLNESMEERLLESRPRKFIASVPFGLQSSSKHDQKDATLPNATISARLLLKKKNKVVSKNILLTASESTGPKPPHSLLLDSIKQKPLPK